MRQGPQKALTGSALDSRVAQFGQRSFVRSVQRGVITIAGASLTGTATIVAVDLANSMLMYLGSRSDNPTNVWNKAFCRLALTNATTVTTTRNTVDENQYVSFDIIEFWPGVIKQVQRGTITLASVDVNTATVTAVNVNKSSLGYLGSSQTSTGTASDILTNLVLTNTTTVTAQRGGSLSGTVIISYQLTELY